MLVFDTKDYGRIEIDFTSGEHGEAYFYANDTAALLRPTDIPGVFHFQNIFGSPIFEVHRRIDYVKGDKNTLRVYLPTLIAETA